MNKQLAGNLLEHIRDRDDVVLNEENGIAYRHDQRASLLSLAACSIGQETFYRDKTPMIDYLATQVAETHPEWLVKLAVWLRQELHMRTIPVRLGAIASLFPACRPVLRLAFPRICARTDDLLAMSELLKDSNQGFARSSPAITRRMIAQALNGLDEYNAIKYRRGSRFGLRHLLQLYHPRPRDERQSLLFRWVLQPGCWQQFSGEERALLPQIDAFEAFKRTDPNDFTTARRYVAKGRLPWEVVIPHLGNSEEAWLVAASQMPIMAMLRNLRNLVWSGAHNAQLRELVLGRLRDPQVVRDSKQLPFRWLAAYHAVVGADKEVAEAVAEALEVSAANLPRWPGRTCIACDNSGSMSYTPMSRDSSLYPRDIGNLIGAMASHLCEDALVLVFGSEVSPADVFPDERIMESQEWIKAQGELVGDSTYAYLVLDHLERTGTFVDRLVILTDMEIYAKQPGVWACEDQHFPLRLSQYRERINPSLQTYLINLQPSAHFIAPESAEGVHYIAGWHSDLLYFVATMDEGATNLVNEISKVSLVAEPNEPDCGEA
jgi:hypothetical protein